MKVLITGANGFIGSTIVQRLLAGGHLIIACGRHRANLPVTDRLTFAPADLNRHLQPDDWLPLLDGVDAVVNSAGILREMRQGEFERVHYRAPLALAHACVQAGVRRFVQISALGHPADGAFVASKHRLDAALAELPLETWVLRPSVVLSLRGSYGGTSMLRAAAAVPGLLFLPGDGQQTIQPILLEDLARIVEKAVEASAGHPAPLDTTGPEIMTLHDYLLAIRRWLKLPPPKLEIRLPTYMVSLAARTGDLLRAGPMGGTLWRMLQRGNIAAPEAPERLHAALGLRASSVSTVLHGAPSFVQDRWHARVYPLRPLAWLALVIIWLVSALAGYTASPADYTPTLNALGIATGWQAGIVIAASSINLTLGILLALRRWTRTVLTLMLISVLAYTLALGVGMPQLWLDLPGGLVKNLGLIALIAISLVLEDPR